MRYLDVICKDLDIHNNIREMYSEDFVIHFYESIDDIDTLRDNVKYMIDNLFDKYFILDMIMTYSHNFNETDLKDKLEQVRECFDSDFWFKYMYFEWDEKGYSSIFELIDVLEIGYFEKHLKEICDRLKNIDY